MSRKVPQVRDCMTHLPVEVEKCLSLADAESLMRKHGIHHLPVMSGSKLIGAVSHQDLLTARLQMGPDAEGETLEAICDAGCLTVHSTSPVHEVAKRMIAQRADNAVVTDGGFVVGVFTSTDALKVLVQVFEP